MVDLRQSPQYAQYMEALGWKATEAKNLKLKTKIYIKKIPILGTFAKLQRPEKNPDIKSIQEFINEHKISIFYYEPLIPLVSHISLIPSHSPFLPSKTIILDLVKSEAQLLKEMHSKTRYNIKIAQRNSVVIQKSIDINLFANLWQTSAYKRGQFLPQKKEIKALFKFFGNKAHLYLTYHTSRITSPIAGLLILDSSDTAFYMYAFSTNEGRKLFAPTLLAWEAISQAKKRKLKVFDFDGIYDPRYPKQNKAWRGFTKFKEGFGGKIVEFPPQLVYYKNPIIKLLKI